VYQYGGEHLGDAACDHYPLCSAHTRDGGGPEEEIRCRSKDAIIAEEGNEALVNSVDIAGVLLFGLAGLVCIYAARQRRKLRSGSVSSSGIRLGLRIWQVVLWVSVFLLIGNGGILAYRFATRQAMLGAQAHLSPLGDHVEMLQKVQYTAENIPAGYSIWVVVRSRASNRFYPQEPASALADGLWEAYVVFGNSSDAGKQFDVFVVLADPLASATFNNYLSEARGRADVEGLRQLPYSTRVLEGTSVERGP
jgi:hypothetical protein